MDKVSLKSSVAAPAIIRKRGFSDDLTLEERKLLRGVVRKHHANVFRDPPNDRMCDELIDAVGPIAWVKMMKKVHAAEGGR